MLHLLCFSLDNVFKSTTPANCLPSSELRSGSGILLCSSGAQSEEHAKSYSLVMTNIANGIDGPFIDDFPSYKPPLSSGVLHGYVK